MTTWDKILVGGLLVLWTVLMLGGPAGALPTTGAATGVTSNNANIPVTGITGTYVWVEWGQNPGGYAWITPNQTASAGSATVRIWGTPLLGHTKYYAVACDQSGCGNEISFTTLAVTPLPTTTYGQAMQNILYSHFNTTTIAGTLFESYSHVIPASIMWGFLFMGIIVGMWFRNKSTRLIGIVMMISSPFIISASTGLHLGITLQMQALGQALLAAGLAGVALSFIKK